MFPDGVALCPEVPLIVHGPDGDAIVLALVDSGAEITLLPESTAQKLGAELDYNNSIATKGYPSTGDYIDAYPAIVELELTYEQETYRWKTTVAFTPVLPERTGVLGYVGCLQFFTIMLDGLRNEVELIPNRNFPS